MDRSDLTCNSAHKGFFKKIACQRTLAAREVTQLSLTPKLCKVVVVPLSQVPLSRRSAKPRSPADLIASPHEPHLHNSF
jgi:hypothetical protein